MVQKQSQNHKLPLTNILLWLNRTSFNWYRYCWNPPAHL